MKRTRLYFGILTSWLLCSTLCVSASFAQSTTDVEKIGQYEVIVFGKEHTKDNLEKRVQALEKSLLGKAGSGSTSSRIEELGKLVHGKTSSEYLPAIPPMMDRSQFMKEPQTAPKRDTTANAPQYDEAPPTADNGERVNGMLREAMGLYSAGKTPEAERVYQSVLAIDFRNPDANFNLGAIAEDKGDLKAAAGYYKAALRTNPDDSELKDALASVEQKLRKNTVAGAGNRGQAPAQQGDENINDPAMKQIAADAAAEYKKGNFDAAISKLNYLAKRSPFDANVQFALGQAYRGKGNDREAARHLRAAATLNPKNDLYVKTANQVESSQDPGQGQLTASNDDGRPAGEITPFSGAVGENSAPRGSLGSLRDMDLGDIAATLLRGQRGFGGLGQGSMGGMGMGFGGMGFGGMPLSGSVDAYGRPYGNGFGGFPGGMNLGFGGVPGSGNMRLRRVVQNGLSGAAMGAMNNRGLPGGMSRGAMRGALNGLMMGGF